MRGRRRAGRASTDLGDHSPMKNSKWIAVAILVLALGVVGLTFGWNLLPDGASAEAKGTYAPWLGTWIMIWVVFGMTVALAGYLFAVGTGKVRSAEAPAGSAKSRVS